MRSGHDPAECPRSFMFGGTVASISLLQVKLFFNKHTFVPSVRPVRPVRPSGASFRPVLLKSFKRCWIKISDRLKDGSRQAPRGACRSRACRSLERVRKALGRTKTTTPWNKNMTFNKRTSPEIPQISPNLSTTKQVKSFVLLVGGVVGKHNQHLPYIQITKRQRQKLEKHNFTLVFS